MKLRNLKIFCVTNKNLNLSKNFPYKIAGVGKGIFPNHYLRADKNDNIFYKEKNYSELTFHYWFWKNKLKNFKKNNWIGFCQKRRFWIKKGINIKKICKRNLYKYLLTELPDDLNDYESIICEPIYLNRLKKMKLFKRGLNNILRNPLVFFLNSKQTIALHFDMHHGYGNLDKAIDLLGHEDREEFRAYVNNNICFNPHIMFIAKVYIAKKWFSSLFSWLFKCEKVFGLVSLQGYDTQRLYAYLAERYLSFWFKKYSKYTEWPHITFSNI